jgi:hypothetical protein
MMDFETKKFACEALATNIRYRRERRWLVFSWSSSILIALIGGVFVLANSTGVDLSLFQRVMLSVAATTITVCASLWIRRGANYQVAEQEILNQYYVDFGMPPFKHAPAITIGTRFTLAILLLGALATIWFTHPGKKWDQAPPTTKTAVPAS